jgi:DNA polymerase-3 subunit gamma/tau
MWPDVMGRLGGLKRTTWSLVSHYAQVLDFDGKRLLLQFDSPGRAASFSKGAHQEFLRQALIDVMGIDCRFEATSGAGASQAPAFQGAASGPAASAPVVAPRPEADAAPRPEGSVQDSPGAAPAAADAAPSQPARPASAPRPDGTRRRPAEPPTDDIPLPPEPPPDDIPPEDPDARRRPAPAAPRSAASSAPASSGTAPAASGSSAASSSAAAVTRPGPAVTSVVLPAGPSVRPADDVPSHDDPDLEGSNLVGASVVEQLLGGRVIEEQRD